MRYDYFGIEIRIKFTVLFFIGSIQKRVTILYYDSY